MSDKEGEAPAERAGAGEKLIRLVTTTGSWMVGFPPDDPVRRIERRRPYGNPRGLQRRLPVNGESREYQVSYDDRTVRVWTGEAAETYSSAETPGDPRMTMFEWPRRDKGGET